MPAGNDFCNHQLHNAVMMNAASDEERGVPEVGKFVYRTDLATAQVCTDTEPDPTLNGGGTWVATGAFGGGAMGTITYQGGGAATVSTGTTITPPLPAPLEDGDLLLCVVAATKSGSAVTPSFPGGWASSSHHGGMHALRWSLYRTGMSDPTLTMLSANDVTYAQIFAYRGARQSNPRLQQTDDFSNSIYLPGSVQSTSQAVIQNTALIGQNGHIAPAGFLLVNFVVFWGTAAGVSVTTANGFTQRGVFSTTTGPDLSVGFADKLDCGVGDNIAGWPIWTLASGTANTSNIGDVIVPSGG